MPVIHIRANTMDPEIIKLRLPGESLDKFTDRLVKLRRQDGLYRQCSIGWHGDCSDHYGQTCTCKCHRKES